MKARIFFFTAKAGQTALRIGRTLRLYGYESRIYTVSRLAGRDDAFTEIVPSLYEIVGKGFQEKNAIIFIGAAGIAVRAVAPHIKDKASDPPVLLSDESGRFVIPLLSGHIGGANGLARLLAAPLGAIPILTTATDVNGLFAVDEWAARKGFALSSLKEAKAFASAALEHEGAAVFSEFPLTGTMPSGLFVADKGPVGIALTAHTDVCPFAVTVAVYPKVLHVGVGCRRGKKGTAICELIRAVFQDNHLALQSVKDINTIDIKTDEAGIAETAACFDVPLRFYDAAELGAVEGTEASSAFVAAAVGVDNVCERAALAGADAAELIVKKYAKNGITVAVACETGAIAWEY